MTAVTPLLEQTAERLRLVLPKTARGLTGLGVAVTALGMQIRGTPKREAYQQADAGLARLGVGPLAGRFPRQLSGGRRKRVALAQVLALEPRLLLMDEPFASLGAIMRHRVTEDLLRWVDREEITVLLVTHDLVGARTDPAFGPLFRRMWDDRAAVSSETVAERRQDETGPWA